MPNELQKAVIPLADHNPGCGQVVFEYADGGPLMVCRGCNQYWEQGELDIPSTEPFCTSPVYLHPYEGPIDYFDGLPRDATLEDKLRHIGVTLKRRPPNSSD